MRGLRWYLPPGVTRPAHLRPSLSPFQLEPDAGPDGRGGMVLGGPYDRSSVPLWKKTIQGWWFLCEGFTQVDIDACLRLRAEPSAELKHDGLAWRVVRLLDPNLTLLPHLISNVGVLSADGTPQLLTVARCEALAERVAMFWHGCRESPDVDANNLACNRLACDVIKECYHLSDYELFAMGVVTKDWTDVVLSQAIGITFGPDGKPRLEGG